MKKVPGVLDLFCGAGGFSEGFKRAGFRILAGVDNDYNAIRSFKTNFPEAYAIAMDIREVNGRDLLKLIGSKPDVIIGSPPCEPFTGANPKREPLPLDRLYKDPVGQLVLHFIRIVGEIKPKVFVMENVPAIMDDGLKDEIAKLFRGAGYGRVYFNVLRAEDYGCPSHRVRVFISNIKLRPRRRVKRVSVAQALRNLPPPGSWPLNHELPPLSERKLKRIARLKPGQSLILYEGAEGRRLPNLIRLEPNKLAPTVLGCSRFIHPYENRFLTVREQARLMGFSDDQVFLGGKDEQYNQVGEAVPPPLAEAIALEVKRYLLSS